MNTTEVKTEKRTKDKPVNETAQCLLDLLDHLEQSGAGEDEILIELNRISDLYKD